MEERPKMAFYLGCITPNRYPQLEKATRFVMEKLGYTLLDMEKATCCPAPGVFRSFNKLDWMVAAARNICIAEKMNVDILTICNGCFGTLQDVNKHLKEDEEAKAYVNEKLKAFGDYEYKGSIEVHHFAEYISYFIGAEEVSKLLVRKVDAKIAIHYGCHFLKPSRIRQLDDPENPHLLEDFVPILGLEPLTFKNRLTCCGAGGGVKAGHANASMQILLKKMEDIDEVKPDFILDICPFCHLQFETGQVWLNDNKDTSFDYPVIHLAQVLAYCMGMDEEFIGMQYQLVGKDYRFKEVVI
ncbi:MAG: CoB--CoM heterodisulfide reductase subunit B [Promethearchaeota archaeon]